jgi:hypothetical protein
VERVSFISVPQFISYQRRHFVEKARFTQFEDSNNPLAVELERENDPACENFSDEPL